MIKQKIHKTVNKFHYLDQKAKEHFSSCQYCLRTIEDIEASLCPIMKQFNEDKRKAFNRIPKELRFLVDLNQMDF